MTSGVRGSGIDFDRRLGKWRARIRIQGQRFQLGHFQDYTAALKVVEEYRPKPGEAYEDAILRVKAYLGK